MRRLASARRLPSMMAARSRGRHAIWEEAEARRVRRTHARSPGPDSYRCAPARKMLPKMRALEKHKPCLWCKSVWVLWAPMVYSAPRARADMLWRALAFPRGSLPCVGRLGDTRGGHGPVAMAASSLVNRKMCFIRGPGTGPVGSATTAVGRAALFSVARCTGVV